MKSIWNGTLRFGLVAIPVGLVPARVDRQTGFRTLHRECSTPVKRPAFCPVHERVLAAEETVLGFEFTPGEFITVEESELAAIAPPASQTIEIRCLIDADRLDPARIERTYYLSTNEFEVGRRSYALLSAVLVKQNRVALARLVFRGAEWVAAVRPHPGRSVLLLHQLAFADEFVDPTPIETSLRNTEIQDAQFDLACELGAKLWFTKPPPKIFEGEHEGRRRQLIDAKLAGGTIVTPAQPEPESEAPALAAGDLTEQLRASIRRPRARQKAKRPARSGPVEG